MVGVSELSPTGEHFSYVWEAGSVAGHPLRFLGHLEDLTPTPYFPKHVEHLKETETPGWGELS